jgi:protein TonB
MRTSSMTVLYGVSFALHASLGMGVREIEPNKEPERIAITVVQPPPKPKAKEEPPPPPPPPPPLVAPAKAKAQPKAKSTEPPLDLAPAPAASAVPTFGIAMTGGVGLGGIAVPMGESLGAPKEPVKRVAQAKSLIEPAKKQVVEDACAEAASKPKPLQMGRPEYTEEARAASIEGKVRVEITVDATGAIRSVKVLEGLGHGLDEAAVRAVEGATFEPALQCGKTVESTFTVSIRFTL